MISPLDVVKIRLQLQVEPLRQKATKVRSHYAQATRTMQALWMRDIHGFSYGYVYVRAQESSSWSLRS